MAGLRRFLQRIVSAVRHDRAEDDLAREVASHLALLEEQFRNAWHDAGCGAPGGAPRLRRRRAGEGTPSRCAGIPLDRAMRSRDVSVWRAQLRAQPGIQRGRGRHARPRHRRGHHHLRRSVRDRAPPAVVRRSRSHRAGVRISAAAGSGRRASPRTSVRAEPARNRPPSVDALACRSRDTALDADARGRHAVARRRQPGLGRDLPADRRPADPRPRTSGRR